MDPGWLKAIDFGCAQQIIGSKPLTRRTGTPVYMVRLRLRRCSLPASPPNAQLCCRPLGS